MEPGMIERHSFYFTESQKQGSRELALLSIISQSLFQPFSLSDNLIVILTALTSGAGVGFNRAMLFLKDGDSLRGEMWLGPGSTEEARSIWEVLSTPGIGYIEVIEYNRSLVSRNKDTLTKRIRGLRFLLDEAGEGIPGLAERDKEILYVRDARNEPRIDPRFLELVDVEEFVCIPLLARDEVLGEIVLDNAITKAPIAASDIKLAGMCGLIAANHIYSASLHRKVVDMEKMAALGEMAVFVTHQVRNPIAAIGGFTEQLLQPGLDEERRQRDLRIIRDETLRLENVVTQIARFLKVSLKEPVAFDIGPVLAAVLESPDLKTKLTKVHLRVKISPCPADVVCDPSSVGELYRNLLENAVEATPEGGAIIVSAYPKNDRWFVLSVRDTGSGISQANRARLFTPFFTTKERGLGLGLPFVKRVMDACGGKIEVESRRGRGTTFRLLFQTKEREKPR
jgi:signal transduction histidine kinase